MGNSTTTNYKIDGFLLDCRNEPALRVRLRNLDNPEHVRTEELPLSHFLSWDSMVGVGDKIDVTDWSTRHIAFQIDATMTLIEKGEERIGSTGGVWLWLAALEMSLRRKLTELTYLGITNAETEKWTTKLGQLVDWQLNNGVTSYFSRLEPGDVVGIDQLFYVEKTQLGHRAWNRRGEVNLPDVRVKHSGIYFPSVGVVGGYREILYKP